MATLILVPRKNKKKAMAAARRQFASEFAGMERSFAEVARLKLDENNSRLGTANYKGDKRIQNKELEFSLKQKLQLAKVDITIEGLTAQIASREYKNCSGQIKEHRCT